MAKLVAVNEAGLPIGEDHPKARYTNREVELVLQLRDQGASYGSISRTMDMPKSTVRNICTGLTRCQTPCLYLP